METDNLKPREKQSRSITKVLNRESKTSPMGRWERWIPTQTGCPLLSAVCYADKYDWGMLKACPPLPHEINVSYWQGGHSRGVFSTPSEIKTTRTSCLAGRSKRHRLSCRGQLPKRVKLWSKLAWPVWVLLCSLWNVRLKQGRRTDSPHLKCQRRRNSSFPGWKRPLVVLILSQTAGFKSQPVSAKCCYLVCFILKYFARKATWGNMRAH